MSNGDKERLPIYFEYIDHYESEKDRKNSAKVWIPRRCAQQDWVLSVWVYRIFHRKFEIALFLAEDCLLFVKDGGVIAALMYCLSDAYFHTGKMELYFCGKENTPTLATGYEPKIPNSIARVAQKFGVSFQNQTFISDAEGRELYIQITGLSRTLQKVLKEKNIDIVRTAFIINRRVWTYDQVQLFAQYSYNPNSILQDGVNPEHFLLYQHDLILLRFALMSERLHTLITKASQSDGFVINTEWIEMNKQSISVNESVSLSLYDGNILEIPKDTRFFVAYIPREMDEYNLFYKRDFSCLGSNDPALYIVTKDFDWTLQSVQQHILNTGNSVMGIVDTLGELDEEIQKRLEQASSSRRSPPERAE